ncbi:B12-binding protein [Geotalea uraniireducens]|uniref:B12-binding protein n=1 Tax=Geotalea uraniireducens TaxID=351604 RepID=A0ABN6VQF1_9BACT|nr:TIGR03960 family B12-binding radical SAM protein [Geotalea uraniireducens]BDV41376.1 B12-binding protein [Geotalea uraniireducens]
MSNNELLAIEKPARYMGGEIGSSAKEGAEIRFVLAFPDVYEVGMSHLGFQILYGVLNAVEWIAAERSYAPWPDRETQLRQAATLLTTSESDTPLVEAEIVGFTLQYELSYTNILNMLDLGGIPLRAAERNERHPLVVGGGPCACNPEPLADFFDAFLLGDGEEAVVEIAEAYREWRRANESRRQLLERLARIDGVYIPSFFSVGYGESGRIAAVTPLLPGYRRVRRRFVADLNEARYPTTPIVPFLKTIHDRVSIEIGRGCTRGCRFCQAGYIYRPVRERSPETILQLVEESLRTTGYDELSLLSLSTGDYGCLTPLLQELIRRYRDQRVAVSLPSLRVGSLNQELVEAIRTVRKTGFTLAPEAGSERLRGIINKGISEEDLLRNSYEAFSNGWRLIKLYFMLGLPGETDEDLLGIADLSRKVKMEGRRAGSGGEVNVSVSTFVPKAHTPFQWEPQIGIDETIARQQFLRRELRARKLAFKWHDAPLSFMEGVFARGDRQLGTVLQKAWELGCRFDGWGDHFSFATWQAAFAATGIEPAFYHRRRDRDEILPWDHLDYGVTKEFLRRELEKSALGIPTEDCRTGLCTGCGICDFDRIKMRLADPHWHGAEPLAAGPPTVTDGKATIRLRYTKTGRMRFLSHLEMIGLFTRAVHRARLPIRFSQGFHPHPKFSFATALSVGIESMAEYMDMEVAPGLEPAELRSRLNAALPAGICVTEATELPPGSPSLSVIIDKTRYRVTLPTGTAVDLPSRAETFLALTSYPFRREKKGKISEYDLRQELAELQVTGNSLELTIGRGKPLEYARAITGLPDETLAGIRIEKLAVLFKHSEN